MTKGFRPKRRTSFFEEVRDVVTESIEFGLRNAPIRWMMLSGFFNGGVAIFAFYAMQPYLLELYGESDSYAIAGIAAAIVAGAQISRRISGSVRRTIICRAYLAADRRCSR